MRRESQQIVKRWREEKQECKVAVFPLVPLCHSYVCVRELVHVRLLTSLQKGVRGHNDPAFRCLSDDEVMLCVSPL